MWNVADAAANRYSRKTQYDFFMIEVMARKPLPKDNVWFWYGRMGREERDDGVGVGGGDCGEESRGVKGAGIEEVWRFCRIQEVSNAA